MLKPPQVAAESQKAVIADVKETYAALATRPVERNCALLTGCCRFKITGRTPYLTRGEALVAARAFRATGRKTLTPRQDGACPMLEEKTDRCMIYENRPFGCRTHFCKAAGGPYERRDVIDLIRRLEEIGARLGGGEARPLAPAVAAELQQLK